MEVTFETVYLVGASRENNPRNCTGAGEEKVMKVFGNIVFIDRDSRRVGWCGDPSFSFPRM